MAAMSGSPRSSLRNGSGQPTRKARGLARSVSAEMHRICEIWCDCRARYGAAGEFLFGDFTAADAMFASVASRFQTYGVELDRDEAEYARAILTMPAVRDWIEDARREPWRITKFDQAWTGSVSLTSKIGAPGFEPGTSPTRTVRATRLRHAPNGASIPEAGRRRPAAPEARGPGGRYFASVRGSQEMP
jgi:hypothetical protein